MPKSLSFKSENISLESIPARSTIKIEAMGGDSGNNNISAYIINAMKNDAVSPTNVFASMDDLREFYSPIDFPKFFNTNTTTKIVVEGWYRISAVGGGGTYFSVSSATSRA